MAFAVSGGGVSMRAFVLRNCDKWARAEGEIIYMAPLLAVAGLHALGEIVNHAGWVQGWYFSPYVAAVAVLSNRVCVRAGLIAALISIPSYNWFWMAGRHAWDWPISNELMAYLSMIVVAFLVAPRKPKPPDSRRIYDAGTDLPFTNKTRSDGRSERSLHGSGVYYWDVQPSGNWAEDCQVGGEYARIFLNRVRASEPGPILGWIIRDMIQKGQYSGVECGFAQGIASHCPGSVAQHHANDRRLN